MADLNDLVIRVRADVDAAVKDINRATREMQTLGRQAESLSRNLESVGTKLTAAISLPLVGLGAVGLSAFGDFESSMNRVSALGDITGQSLKNLTTQAKQLGADTQYSAKEAADGMGAFAASGFDATQIMKAMPGTLDLAAAGQLAVADAAEIASNVMGQFGISADGVSHAVDVIALAASSGSLSVQDMGLSLKYAGPVAKTAGLSLESVSAAMVLLSNSGIKGSDAGTAIRGSLASLIDPSKEGAKVLGSLGVKVTDATGKMKPLAQIINDLNKAGITQAQTFQLVGRESASAFQVLLSKGPAALQEIEAKLIASDGAAKRMAGILNGGLKGAFEQMKGSVEGAAISLGEQLAPYATKVLVVLTDLANWAAKLADKFGSLPQPVKTTILVLGAIAAAAGPVLLALGGIASLGGVLTSGIGILTTALKVVSTGMGLFGIGAGAVTAPLLATVAATVAATAAIAALGYWIYSHWAQITAVFKQYWEGATEFLVWALEKAAGAMGTSLKGIGETIAAGWKWVSDITMKVWNAVADWLTGLWKSISEKASAIFDGISNKISAIINRVKGWDIPGLNKILTLDKAWNSVKTTVEAVAKATDKIKTPEAKVAPALGVNTFTPDFSDAGSGKAAKPKKTKEGFDIGQALSPKALADAIESLLKSRIGKILNFQAEGALKEATVAAKAFAEEFVIIGDNAKKAGYDIGDITQMTGFAALGMDKLSQAVKRAGITTDFDLREAAKAAQEDYDTLRTSGVSSVNEIAQAYRNYLKAVIDVSRARGEDVTKLEKDLAKVTEQIDGKKPAKGLQEVSTVLTNMNQGIAQAIVQWKGFGSVVTGILQNIGQAIISKMLSSLVLTSGRIDSLSNGLSGILGKIPGLSGVFGTATKGIADGVGAATKTITGAAGAAASTVADVAGKTASAVGSTASKAVGTATKAASSGLSSVLGMATGAISAVTGIISVFQNASMGKDIARIEVTSRGILNQSISIQNSLNRYLPWLEILNGSLANMTRYGLGVYSQEQTVIKAQLVSGTIAGGNASTGGGGTSIVVNGNLYGGSQGLTELANAIAAVLRLQGARI